MSPTEGTGRMPKPMRYRRYSARVQLVPKGMGAQTSKRKARPSSAAMAAARIDAAARRRPLRPAALRNYCLNRLLEPMQPRLPGGRHTADKFYHKTVCLLVSYIR